MKLKAMPPAVTFVNIKKKIYGWLCIDTQIFRKGKQECMYLHEAEST